MGFIGYASRMNPVTLPAGMLQISENMRLDRGVAVTRKGAKRMATGIAPANTPLTVPFVLVDDSSGPVVQAVYDGGIFASAVIRSPDAINSFEAMVLAGSDRAYIETFDAGGEFSEEWGGGPIVTVAGEELITSVGDTIISTLLPSELSYPTSPDEIIEPDDKVSMLQAFNRVYLLRETNINREGWQTKGVTASGITVSGTTATVFVSTHGYSADMRVRIEGGAAAAFSGHEFAILGGGANAPTTDTFKITVPTGTATDLSTSITVRRVKPPLFWDGDPGTEFVRSPAGVPAGLPATYKTLRSAPWATYANGRLVIPDGRDNVLISDVLNPNVYDPFFSSFRANQGSNDFLVAVQPWVEGSFLVFMRKSIWLATINQFASTDGSGFSVDTPVSNLQLLTDEVGCSARKSIAVAGNFVFFLSDSGVYRLDSRLDLKLRGDTKPLSDPIADQLQNIDPNLAANAVGLWHDNRYHLAVPYGSSPDSNNALFIWSALNDQWETRDEYGFGVDDILVATYERERRLFSASRAGIIMLLNEIEAGDDAPDPSVLDYIGTVPGRIVTRRYGMGTMTDKRFVRSLADVVLPDTASVTIKAVTVNPDREITLVPNQTNTSGEPEDYTLKNPIRQKAHYCELEFLTTANRPEIRNVSVEAALASRPQTETRHAA
jgi:hypothetical protein